MTWTLILPNYLLYQNLTASPLSPKPLTPKSPLPRLPHFRRSSGAPPTISVCSQSPLFPFLPPLPQEVTTLKTLLAPKLAEKRQKMVEESSTTPKSFINQSVVPGDVVLDLSTFTHQTIKLCGGLRQEGDAISVMKAGKLRFAKPNKYWVESSHKRYVPCVEDHVLGIVLDCRADNFLVDIKGPTLAFLPVLAFEGVIRKNIPNFKTGTLLYARVVKANAGMSPELSCTDASGKAAEFGPLNDGFMFETATGLSRMLLSSPACPLLEGLGKKLSFEIAVGLNGRVWVNAESPAKVILVSNAIMKSGSLSPGEQKTYVEKLLERA